MKVSESTGIIPILNKKHLNDDVIIVGAGITSIMTALRLSKAGFKIKVYTKGPDPRRDHDAEQYSATGNGRSARFVTGLEGKPHFFEGLDHEVSKNELFTEFNQGGWLTKPADNYTLQDQAWLQKRHEASMDASHSKSLYDEYYTVSSRASIAEWIELQTTMPQLFKNADVTNPDDGVLVLCNSESLLHKTVQEYEHYKFLKRILTKVEVVELAPVYEAACSNGSIAGGLIVEGFAFNIHRFIDNCLDYLESQYVQFIWGEEILDVIVDVFGDVSGLMSKTRGIVSAKHYSLNPGAYADKLLNNTPARDKVGGVAGRWLIIPRPKGFSLPTKILTDSRVGPSIGDNNLTPFSIDGQRMVAVSGGSVYVGSSHYDMPSSDICLAIDNENERILQMYMPAHYQQLKDDNNINAWTNTCLRSFTYDDRPVHDVLKTNQSGTLTITAGTNTGTTALAPYLAQWIEKQLVSMEK